MDFCEHCLEEFEQEELTYCSGLWICEDCEDLYEEETDNEGFHEVELEDF